MESDVTPAKSPILRKLMVLLFFHAVPATLLTLVLMHRAENFDCIFRDFGMTLPAITVFLMDTLCWSAPRLPVILLFWVIFLIVDATVFAALSRRAMEVGALAWALGVVAVQAIIFLSVNEALMAPLFRLMQSVEAASV